MGRCPGARGSQSLISAWLDLEDDIMVGEDDESLIRVATCAQVVERRHKFGSEVEGPRLGAPAPQPGAGVPAQNGRPERVRLQRGSGVRHGAPGQRFRSGMERG